ncbi:MAG: hemolysin family protein [Bacteroidota bacterium]
MSLLLFYVGLAIGVSFLCSIMEAVILSVTPSYVAALEKDGNPVGTTLREMKAKIDRPLATILSWNTVANTMGAAGAGAQAAIVFESISVGVFSAILTLLILVFSEIIPKTLGALHWRILAPFVVKILKPAMFISMPLILLSDGITHLLTRNRVKATISREEFTALAEMGQKEGVFEENESRILKNLFRFASILVKDIMTPRIVVYALPVDKTIDEVVAEGKDFRFSRIVVYRENRDQVIGYVLKDQILLKAAQGKGNQPLENLMREITVVPDTMPLSALFERLTGRLDHIAMVVDEYGGFAGIVTMEDIVETLLGMEIVDEADAVTDMQELARQQWLIRAQRLGLVSENLEEFNGPEYLPPPPPPSPKLSDPGSDVANL